MLLRESQQRSREVQWPSYIRKVRTDVEKIELADKAATSQADELELRLIELEVRSEERRADNQRLEEFVRGFENRLTRLEKAVMNLSVQLENPPEEMPAPTEDLPPHY